jgi:hypothetical protein
MMAEFPKSISDMIGFCNKISVKEFYRLLWYSKENELYKLCDFKRRDKEIQKASKLISKFFAKEPKKVNLWIETPNPLLGGASPLAMILMGRYAKLEQFIVVSLWEGSPPGTPFPKKYLKYFPKG